MTESEAIEAIQFPLLRDVISIRNTIKMKQKEKRRQQIWISLVEHSRLTVLFRQHQEQSMKLNSR